jgi:hypothetical protein
LRAWRVEDALVGQVERGFAFDEGIDNRQVRVHDRVKQGRLSVRVHSIDRRSAVLLLCSNSNSNSNRSIESNASVASIAWPYQEGVE